jgi:hypothetical protein
MKFDITVKPLLMKEPKPISVLVDALKEETKYGVSYGYIDHANNKATVYSSIDFERWFKLFYKKSIDNGILIIDSTIHHQGHKTFLDKDGYMKCGCGWIETKAGKDNREFASQMKDLKIVTIEDIP